MATKTPNYGLTKPAGSDYYNVEDFNGNADLIDAALKKLADEKANLDENGKVPVNQLPEGTLTEDDKGEAGGVAELDENGKVPADQLPEYAPEEHTHAADGITAGTFKETGVKAKDGTDYGVSRVRNIILSPTDLTAGSSPLASGSIYIVYE